MTDKMNTAEHDMSVEELYHAIEQDVKEIYGLCSRKKQKTMTQDMEHTPVVFPQEECGSDTMAADPATVYGRTASTFLTPPDAVPQGESHQVDYSFLDENLKETAAYIREKLSKKGAHVRFSPQKKVDGGVFKDKYHEFLDALHSDYARRRGIAYKQDQATPEGTVSVDEFFDGLNAFIEWSYAEA